MNPVLKQLDTTTVGFSAIYCNLSISNRALRQVGLMLRRRNDPRFIQFFHMGPGPFGISLVEHFVHTGDMP